MRRFYETVYGVRRKSSVIFNDREGNLLTYKTMVAMVETKGHRRIEWSSCGSFITR